MPHLPAPGRTPFHRTRSAVNWPCRAFTHDLDGNLTQDGDYTYAWDAENRLIQVTPVDPYPKMGHKHRVHFEYDYMGRRVRKVTYPWNVGTEDWMEAPDSDIRFVYDGWNLVQEIDGLVEVECRGDILLLAPAIIPMGVNLRH